MNNNTETLLEKSLTFNAEFVASGKYKPFVTTKYPDHKIAILTCMDTRLIELLPASLGFKNGDVKMIKNAGGIISHPYGSVVRSLLIAIYELGVNEVWVIGHTDCGNERLKSSQLIPKMKARGVSDEVIAEIEAQGIDFDAWLDGFPCVEAAVQETCHVIHHHPLLPHDVRVVPLLINPNTGEVKEQEPDFL